MELHDLDSSRNVVRILISRKMRWVGYIADMGEKWNAYRNFVKKPEGEYVGDGGEIIGLLTQVLQKWDAMDSWGSEEGSVACCCKRHNESCSILWQCTEVLLK